MKSNITELNNIFVLSAYKKETMISAVINTKVKIIHLSAPPIIPVLDFLDSSLIWDPMF